MKKYRKSILVFTTVLSVFFTVNAQDGAKLFKQNCAACHKIDTKLVGPKLIGALAKWEEAGEKEFIYEWVANPTELHDSGKSKMANAIWDFSPAAMSPLPHLTKEEVDAIFAFVDTPPVIAQDGAKLFKQNCAACHKIDTKLVGPPLKGALAKWEEAGEKEFIYEWVTNPTELHDSGKSKMANAIWDFSPAAMSPLPHLTKGEIDAIFTFVDTPPAIIEEPVVEKSIVKPVAQSKGTALSNGTLIIIGVLLLFIVITTMILSNASKTLKEDQINLEAKGHKSAQEFLSFSKSGIYYMVLLLVLGYLFFYQVFNFETTVYFILITGFLLVAYFIMKRAIKSLTKEGEKVDSVLVNNQELTYDNNSGLGFLTQAVSIEDESAILLDHDYDGIKELDNVLPPWWVWMFYGTIIFAFVYWGLYQTFSIFPLQEEAYKIEMAQSDKDVYRYKKANNLLISANNVSFLTDPTSLAAGKDLFDGTCKVCHLSGGEGSVGPNLTDKYWLYGGTAGDLFTSVTEGRPNGMPAQKSSLNERQIQQLISYVHSLKFKEGKAPEGELMK